ncbi:MAG: ribonuclease D [Gammaproteobacteria bacterium]
MRPTFIESHAQLQRACDNWLNRDAVGLDTEFERTRTYYSRPALVQVFDGEQVSFIDPLTVEDFAPLAEFLQRSRVTKVMHASEGDIEVLEQLTGVTPQPIFDTQMAAAFTGHGYSLGYRKLVQMLLGEELAKGETRSDWLKRPLSDAQVSYAALDVVHLLPMYRQLRDTLIGLGRDGWLHEEIQRVQKRRTADRDPRRAYLRFRQTRLASAELARLRELAAWREEKARDRDLPRQMIVRDRSLLAMALSGPANAGDLADIPELSANAVKRYAHSLLGAIEQAHGDDTPPVATPAMERRLAPWLKAMKELLKQKSESLNMPAPLLAQARTLESLVVAAAAGEHELPEELRGWREAVVGAPLMTELQRLAGA